MDGKICQNIKPPTSTRIPSSLQLSTWGRLGYIRFLYFLLFQKNVHFFSDSLLPKILKFSRLTLRLVFLIKIFYNQFLLLKNYRLWHWNKVSNKKGSLKKRKTSNNRSRVFEITLEGGRKWKGGGNWNFAWESFYCSMVLSC